MKNDEKRVTDKERTVQIEVDRIVLKSLVGRENEKGEDTCNVALGDCEGKIWISEAAR